MAAGFGLVNIAQISCEFSNAPGQHFPMCVKEVAQVAYLVTQTFCVRFTMKAPLRPTVLRGMAATVDVTYYTSGASERRILVPVSATVNQTDQQIVWIPELDETVRCRTAKIGIVTDGQVEILSDLPPGDRVAVA